MGIYGSHNKEPLSYNEPCLHERKEVQSVLYRHEGLFGYSEFRNCKCLTCSESIRIEQYKPYNCGSLVIDFYHIQSHYPNCTHSLFFVDKTTVKTDYRITVPEKGLKLYNGKNYAYVTAIAECVYCQKQFKTQCGLIDKEGEIIPDNDWKI